VGYCKGTMHRASRMKEPLSFRMVRITIYSARFSVKGPTKSVAIAVQSRIIIGVAQYLRFGLVLQWSWHEPFFGPFSRGKGAGCRTGPEREITAS
jgi:hypothetical protein